MIQLDNCRNYSKIQISALIFPFFILSKTNISCNSLDDPNTLRILFKQIGFLINNFQQLPCASSQKLPAFLNVCISVYICTTHNVCSFVYFLVYVSGAATGSTLWDVSERKYKINISYFANEFHKVSHSGSMYNKQLYIQAIYINNTVFDHSYHISRSELGNYNFKTKSKDFPIDWKVFRQQQLDYITNACHKV